MRRSEVFSKIIKEHFDITNTETRRYLLGLEEAGQDQVVNDLTTKLYQIIIDKVDDIDFGTIPMSKGDITKVDGIDKVAECLEVIEGLIEKCNQDVAPVKTIVTCVNNIRDRKALFEKGYALDLELPCMIYNVMVLAIFDATSFLVSTCTNFIKDAQAEPFNIVLEKTGIQKSKQYVSFKNIDNFNTICKNGTLDKCLNSIYSTKQKNFMGTLVGLELAGVVAAGGVILAIIPIMRELIYFYYFAKVSVSDYTEMQADLIQANAYRVESDSTIDKEKRKKIADKQLKVVDKLRKISNAFAIKTKKAENQSSNLIKSEKTAFNINATMDSDSLF